MKISVIVPTYNHEMFIRQCLDSILYQETNFEYEILIGEDGSSDNTREIVEGYEKQYPDRIRLFLNDRSNVIYVDGNPTGTWNFINLVKHSKGEYVAICEGDDYWTDSLKLQKQVDFLDENHEFSICFHDIVAINDKGEEVYSYSDVKQYKYNIEKTFEEILVENFIPTASVVFRNKLIDIWPDWVCEFPFIDWPLNILNAQKGKIIYLNQQMAVYRLHHSSCWSSKSYQYRLSSMLLFQFSLNKYLDYKYEDIIKKSIVDNFIKCVANNEEINGLYKESNQQLQEKDQQLQEKDQQLQEKDQQLQEKDQQLQEKNQQLQERDQQLQSITRELAEKGNYIESILQSRGWKLLNWVRKVLTYFNFKNNLR